jgi:AraC-like DNA-binding protein
MPWSKVFTFDDPLAYQSTVQGADVELLPTSRGRFYGELTQVRLEKVWMQRFFMSLPQLHVVENWTGRTVLGFLTDRTSSTLQHRGIDVLPGEIAVSGMGVFHQRSAADHRHGVVSLADADLRDFYKAIVGSELPENRLSPIVRPKQEVISRLLTLHRVVGQLAHETPDLFDLPEVVKALEQQLIHAMIRCLAEGVPTDFRPGSRRHDTIVKRFEEFLGANQDRAVYLPELCKAVGAAERTLRASCEEHLGMGPVRYLTLRRMNLVRRALLRADQSTATVTQIVTGYGFWELGRFSVAYRRVFGELPSESLRRPPELQQPARPSSGGLSANQKLSPSAIRGADY